MKMQSRIIKFRVWNPATKDLLRSDELDLSTFFIALEILDVEGMPYNLMQFTGLKDRNGIEIYENDIVKIKILGESKEDETTLTEVEFNNGEYNITDWYFGPVEESEVIGNIYEHPELLETKLINER